MDAKLEQEITKEISWRGQWLGWISLAVLVFFTWLPNSYLLMVAYPWIAVWQLGFLLLGVWAIWMLRQFGLPFRGLGYGLDWVVGLIVVTLIVSGAFSEFPQVAAWNVSMALCYGVLLYVLRNWIGRGLDLERLWIWVACVGMSTGAISLACWGAEMLERDVRRNGYPMGNPNIVAGYMLLLLPLAAAFSVSRQGWQRIGGLAGSALIAGSLYTTGSRGGVLGVLVLALVGAGLWVVRSRGKQRWRRLMSCMLALAVILLLVAQHPRVQKVVQIASSTANAQAVQVQVDEPIQERLLMWRTSLNILRSRPLLGVGPGNMARVYNLYRPIETGRGGAHIQQLHNTPLQIVGELGLVGLGITVLLLGFLCRLWCRLYQKLAEPTERRLLYGVGGGVLAYSVLSLTEYQLENINISGTLAVMVAILLGLADSAELTKSAPINRYRRRWFSLGSITALVLAVILWLPVTGAMYLSWMANKSLQAGNLVDAQNKLTVSANLVPWDPTYSLLAGFQMLKVQEGIKEEQLAEELNEITIRQFENAVEAAPNDAFFNRNLGLVYGDEGDSKKAQKYLSRAIQLLPQIQYYTYYLLGREYLAQQETEKAVAALAIQGLIDPEFLTLSLWSQAPLLNVKKQVLKESLNLIEVLLKDLSSPAGYSQVYENLVILRWWHRKDLGNLELSRLRPIVQALILADDQPQQALKIINKSLQQQPRDAGLFLLRAWIDPQQYWDDYLNSGVKTVGEEEQKLLRQSIVQRRDVRAWLSTSKRNIKDNYRNALDLTYRNANAPRVAHILAPQEVQVDWIVQLLDIFQPYPLKLPTLDRVVYQAINEKLNIT
ncbi:MAG: O-antigen ligase family protein [Cyanophyceae cyanobacterium]